MFRPVVQAPNVDTAWSYCERSLMNNMPFTPHHRRTALERPRSCSEIQPSRSTESTGNDADLRRTVSSGALCVSSFGS